MRLYTVPFFLKMVYPERIWEIKDGTPKSIYLTFDDGPTPQLTDWILELLDEYVAKASFFCVGQNLESFPLLATKIREGGHLVANHTWQHKDGWRTENEDYLTDVQKCELLTNNKIFRPPYGRLKMEQARLLRLEGYKIIMWSLLTYDFDPKLDCEKAFTKIRQNARPGSILVFHDNPKAESNIRNLLPRSLEYLSGQGYEFAALDPTQL